MKKYKDYVSPAVFGGSDGVFAVPALLATAAAAVAVGWGARAMRGDSEISVMLPALEPCELCID